MENEDYKFDEEIEDHFYCALIDMEDREFNFLSEASIYYKMRLQFIADVITTYFKIKTCNESVRQEIIKYTNNNTGFYYTTKLLGIHDTMSSKIILAHFGYHFNDSDYYDKNGVSFNVYTLEKHICSNRRIREQIAHDVFVHLYKKTMHIEYLNGRYITLNNFEHIDIATGYVLQYIDSAIDYMQRYYKDYTISFMNVFSPFYNTAFINSYANIKMDININKLNNVANNIKKISKSKTTDSIISSMVPIIIANKTKEAACNNIDDIKKTVSLCIGDNEDVKENINDIGNMLIESL